MEGPTPIPTEYGGYRFRSRLEVIAMLNAALSYAARGWRVFPCRPRGKTPLTPHGFQDASTDEAVIREWWTRWPDANIGIATGQASRLAVVDVDPPAGEETLDLLTAMHGEFETLTSITGRDGTHYLFTHDAPLSGRNGGLGLNVDVKADGGYIIAPPSIHETGRPYVWPTDPDAVELAPLPTWIVEVLESTRNAPREAPTPPPATNGHAPTGRTPLAAGALERLVEEVATTPEGGGPFGGRDNGLFHAAARMGEFVAGGQIDEHEVRDALTRAGIACGLDGRDVARAIQSGLTRGAQQPAYPETRTTRTVSPAPATRGPDDAPDGRAVAVLADGFRDSDAGNADRFIGAVDGRARYVHAWGRWIVYDDAGVWKIDNGEALVTELAKQVAARMFALVPSVSGDARDKLYKHAKKCESATAIGHMIRLARGAPGILVDHTKLDTKPWLLNVANGTVDLRTGELRPHDPDDLLTVQAPTLYDANATAPLFEACLERWQPDAAMRSYLQEVVGTGAIGTPIEQLFINLGPGGNGKSKFYGAVADTLGEYVVVPHKALLTVQRHEQHDTIKARLFGARLAIASETQASDRIDEAKVKEITGGDVLEARRMREDPWKFRPTHTMVMHTNHRPRIDGVDEGVWRRVRLLPWDVTIPVAQQDTRLAEKLAAEAPGILNWIIAGAVRWQEHGFTEPPSVVAATASYRAGEDRLAGFIEECFDLIPGHRESNTRIIEAYERWCEATGEDPMTKTALGRALQQRGLELTGDRRFRVGLRLFDNANARVVTVSPITAYARAPEETNRETITTRASTTDADLEGDGWTLL